MLLVVFDEIDSTAYFHKKMLDQKVDKTDLNLSKQYVKEHIKKI